MSTTERDYTEKRNFIRMKVDTPVLITTTDGSGTTYTGVCKDLSGAGMLLESSDDIPMGIEIRVSIQSGKQPFEATATVARVKTTASSSYIYGLKIQEIQ